MSTQQLTMSTQPHTISTAVKKADIKSKNHFQMELTKTTDRQLKLNDISRGYIQRNPRAAAGFSSSIEGKRVTKQIFEEYDIQMKKGLEDDKIRQKYDTFKAREKRKFQDESEDGLFLEPVRKKMMFPVPQVEYYIAAIQLQCEILKANPESNFTLEDAHKTLANRNDRFYDSDNEYDDY